MRQLRLKPSDVESVVLNPDLIDVDVDGRSRYAGYVGAVRIRVVVALDDPELVVTVHERRRR